jgi:hypothetical protein
MTGSGSTAAGRSWDFPADPTPLVEREILSNVDVKRFSARNGVTTEAAPIAERQL